MQHIHIIGICGTFMAGVAQIAKSAGYRVSGCDAHVYPPMSTQLEQAGIEIMQGFDPAHLTAFPEGERPNEVIIGNALSRGSPIVEAVLNQNIPYTSGPEWLSRQVLQSRWVLAVSGTHGKTTTASMLAWILEYAGLEPGFLIGGVPENFGVSARLGGGSFFVIEADEYDTAFFDKRSKFVHYRPRTLSINNLEFDHADIFDDLSAIQRQFHHLIRCVPEQGRIIAPADTPSVSDLLQQGCWSELEKFAPDAVDGSHSVLSGWQAQWCSPDGSQFNVLLDGESQGLLTWSLLGAHNVQNALCAIAMARHVGVTPEVSIQALGEFNSVKRRLELKGEVKGVRVYDDFAHHPTAIKTTLDGIRANVGDERVIAVLELRSNTMQMGHHDAQLTDALMLADEVWVCVQSEVHAKSCEALFNQRPSSDKRRIQVVRSADTILSELTPHLKPSNHVVIMSNGAFSGIHQRLIEQLKNHNG